MSWLFRRKKNILKPFFRRHALSFEVMEPRLLLSADAFGGVVDADDIDVDTPLLSNYDKIRDDLHFKLLQSSTQDASLLEAAKTTVSVLSENDDLHSKIDLTLLNHFFSGEAESADDVVKQIVFVDAQVEDVELLLSDAYSDSRIKVIEISGDDQSLAFMTEQIHKYSGLDAVHLVSHGSSGSLALGGETFDLDFLQNEDNQQLLSSWQSAMAENADLLIYGCNYAQGESGKDALNAFAQVTGLNAAASDDVTGSLLAGGDWYLEQSVGTVDTQLLVSLDVAATWDHSLATIVVNTTEDTFLSGNKTVSALLNDSEISLREAIQAVNMDVSWGVVHTIVFDLDGDHTINLSSQLPSLQRAMVIDATTEPDYAGEPVVTINGNGNDIFHISGSYVEVRGLELTGGDEAIFISGFGNTIAGNHIVGNSSYGIYVSGSNNMIGGSLEADRNIISGNGDSGIRIAGSNVTGNTVEGNWIGLAADGETSYGNAVNGITINTAFNTEVIDNVISGNAGHGLQVFREGNTMPSGVSILGNIVGLDASGTKAVGNNDNGIELYEVVDAHVGDGTEAGRNIVSGNESRGVYVVGANNDEITIMGNYIGTDISGSVGIGNGLRGVGVYDGPTTGYGSGYGGFSTSANDWSASDSARVYIGGDLAGEGNLISGNLGDGIYLNKQATEVSIVNNTIGLDASGLLALGNQGSGIVVISGVDSTGLDAKVYIQDNVIAHNEANGILVSDPNTFGVYIFKNVIYGNKALSVDLGGDGLTQNDTADVDNGANRLMNYAEISSVSIVNDELRIQGSLAYSANTIGSITINFYYAMAQGSEDNAYATHYIGEHTFTSGYASSATFDVSFDVDIPSGALITASTLSPHQVGSSEFAPAVALTQGNIPNQSPDGSVSITGSLIQGALLTASSTLTDANGMSNAVQYQWRRNGTDIDGANDDTYTLTQVDVGATISLNISYVDDQNYSESETSEESLSVVNVNDVGTGTVTITGDRLENATLTATQTLTDIDGLPAASSYTYQWYRDDVAIVDQTLNSYTLTQEDVGTNISVAVHYIDLFDNPESIRSNSTSDISNVNDDPDGFVRIDGTQTEDAALTAFVSLTDEDGLTQAFRYQWYRDDVSIAGAESVSYTLGDDDVGARIKVEVSYEDDQGASELVYSAETAAISNVNDQPDGELAILGSNVEGSTLSAQVKFTDADGISGVIAYQWYRGGVEIVGEVDKDYLLTNDDVGLRLSVTATYVDDANNTHVVTSEETKSVNNTNQVATGSVSIEGEVKEGQTLSVNTLSLADEDGLPSVLNYQWYRDDNLILDATSDTYLLGDDDVGTAISVEISYEDNLGSNESMASAKTIDVVNINDLPTGDVTISGSNIEGQTLTARINIVDADGLTGVYQYQWLRNDVAIVGKEGATYALTESDVDADITVLVSYTDAHNTVDSVLSQVFGPIQNLNQGHNGTLDINGTYTEDETLTAIRNFTDADGLPGAFMHQWYRNGIAIESANAVQYQLGDDDVGQSIHVTVTYFDLHGSEEVVKSEIIPLIANVDDPHTGQIQIMGSAQEGQLLTLSNTIEDLDGIVDRLPYQWLRDGKVIAGATENTYVLQSEDVGTSISVRWQYTSMFGEVKTVVGSTFSNIQNENANPTGSVTISGSAEEDQVLTVTYDIEDADGIASDFAVQWYRDGNVIAGEVGSTYQLSDADVSATVQVIVSYTDQYNTEESIASSGFGPVTAINDDFTGTLVLTGDFEEDGLITIVNTVDDADGMPIDLSYSWYRDGVLMDGQNGLDLTLGQQDVGAQFYVELAYTDLNGFDEVVTSLVSLSVSNLNDLPLGALQLATQVQEGQTLTFTNTVTDEDGIQTDLGYQWYRNGEVISGANQNEYLLQDLDVGTNISVAWFYEDAYGEQERVDSNVTDAVGNLNSGPDGQVTITGELEEDKTLSVSHDLTDADGFTGAYQYQWYRNDELITDADTASLTLSDIDVGTQISVVVLYTDARGTPESMGSGEYGPINAVNDMYVGSVTVQGELIENTTLSITDTVTDVDGISSAREYRWYRDGEVITGQNMQNYTLVDADVGARISAELRYTDDQGFIEVVSSTVSDAVVNVNDEAQGSVEVSGSLVEDSILSAVHTLSDDDGLPEYLSYQWYRNGEAIDAANESNYQLTATDIDTRISVSVSYTDEHGGDESVVSEPSETIVWVNHVGEGALSVVGQLSPGSVLSLRYTINDPDEVASELQYQWQRDGEDILGADTTEYEVTYTDQGSTLSVLITYVDARGFEEVLVSPTVDIPRSSTSNQTVVDSESVNDQSLEVLVELSAAQAQGESGEADEEGSQDKDSSADAKSDAEERDRIYLQDQSDIFETQSNSILDRAQQQAVAVYDFSIVAPNETSLRLELIDAQSLEWVSTELKLDSGDLPSFSDMLTILNASEYDDRVKESVQELKKHQITLSNAVVGGTAAASTGLSVGYLLWTLRSGVLMTSLLSSLPAWRFIDPLPILGGGSKDKGDDESLESMLESERIKRAQGNEVNNV